jgi:triacylglycerol esterase/lipase EstA (alpha/beta hydrolase family)
MRTNGRALIPIPIGKNSLFAPAPQSRRTLVVFVHGFRGKALSTWLSFPDFVDAFDGLRDADLLFYGYASAPQRMQNMANNLRAHMDLLWQDVKSLGSQAVYALSQRRILTEAQQSAPWDRVLFVAHSLGAVVVRRALLDSFLEGTGSYTDEHWSRLSSLCFFAPAHSGADVLKLINETFSTLGLPIGPVLKGRYPCLQDLEKESTALKDLRDDYRDLPETSRIRVRAVSVTHTHKLRNSS